MRMRDVNRTMALRLAAVGVVAALGTLSGCGSDDAADSGNSPQHKQTSAPAAKKAPAHVLSQQELDHAALVATDLTKYSVETIAGKGKPVGRLDADHRTLITAKGCQPLYDMTRFVTAYPATTGRVVQAAEDTSTEDGQQTVVTLASYTKTTAAQGIADLRKSLGSCTAFVGPVAGDTYTYKGVTALPDPHLGDEAVSYRMDRYIPGISEGESAILPPAQEIYVVVRVGATLVSFSSFAIPTPGAHPAQIPPQVLTAQLKKLT